MRLCFCRDLGTGPGCAPPSVGSEKIGSWGCQVVPSCPIAHQAHVLRILGYCVSGTTGLGVPSYARAISLGSYLWTISQGGPVCSELFLLGDEHTFPTLPLFGWHCQLLTTFSQYHILVLTLGVRTKLLSLSVSLILKPEADQDTSDE